MDESNFLVIVAGSLAYCVAIVLGAGPLAYAAYLLDKTLTQKIDEDSELKRGNRAIAIELGTTIFCQALLVPHAVFAAMAVVRSLFVEELEGSAIAWIIFRSGLCIAIIVILAMGSVHFCGWVFKKFMRHMDVAGAIQRGNIAMATFFALVLLSMALVLNEGMEDFSRSLIPYGRAGIVELP
jgi:uncharacterized membrane protein YjfL (UPF0719 family)